MTLQIPADTHANFLTSLPLMYCKYFPIDKTNGIHRAKEVLDTVQVLVHYIPQAKSGLLGCFCQVSLEHSHTMHCLTCSCFHTTITLYSCNANHLACKALHIYHLALYRKGSLTPNCPHKIASRAEGRQLGRYRIRMGEWQRAASRASGLR